MFKKIDKSGDKKIELNEFIQAIDDEEITDEKIEIKQDTKSI
jgi:hypothetical protein